MEKDMPLQVNLEYGPFFNYGEMYHVSFEYSNEEQKNNVREFFQNVLPIYGMNGNRHLNEGKEAIMPYFEGDAYGGTSIPEDLLTDFLKRFIEVDNANVHVGNVMITGKIDDGLLDSIVESISPNLDKDFNK